jgi:hypothetical protein
MPKEKKDYTFIGKCDSERFGTIMIGYRKADLDKMAANMGETGWGNMRLKFRKADNRPFLVLVEPYNPSKQPDRMRMPEETVEYAGEVVEVNPPEEVNKESLPF